MDRPTHKERLLAIAGACETGQTPQLAPLIDALRNEFGPAITAILYYGSCLRSGDIHDGLIDFYVIIDDYAHVHHSRAMAWLNAAIPPNVYYRECATAQGRLRCKYALLSIGQLERGAEHWFQSGIWGRFAQPVAIVYARDDAAHTRIRRSCGIAVVGLLRRALPTMAERVEPAFAFAQALALSYASELRVERGSRTEEMVAADRDEYRRRFLAALPLLAFDVNKNCDGSVHLNIPSRHRAIARISWPLRHLQGKCLSVLRLAKACFTFSQAVDYAAWKIERHTGHRIAVSERLRRYPLIYGWPVLWRLYRQRKLR